MKKATTEPKITKTRTAKSKKAEIIEIAPVEQVEILQTVAEDSVESLFIDFYQSRNAGSQPDDSILALFREIAE